MAFRKCIPLGDAPSVVTKPMSSFSKLQESVQLAEPETSDGMQPDIDMDLSEVYFLIMHFLSAGPCQRTYAQLWNELIEHQLLPRRYHAWYSRNGAHNRDGNDDGLSLPLNYDNLVERYPHIEKNHLVKLLKQLLLRTASPLQGTIGGHVPNAAHVPTLLGTGSFSLLSSDMETAKVEQTLPPAHMRWPHMRADQVRGLSLREVGGGFSRHHRAPSVRAACYAIEKPSTMVQKMQNIKRLRGHRNAVYCAIFDRTGRYVITGSDDRLVKIWSMETAFCLASCRGHEGDITDLAVSSNNALVASSSNDCIIRVWRLPDGYPISVLRGHTGAVTAIAFSPRPNCAHQLLSSSDDGTCRIWDARYSNFRPRIYVPRPSDSVTGKNGGSSSSNGPQSHQIFCCSFNANGSIFVTGSSDHHARVWNACRSVTDDLEQPNHEIDVLSGHENDVNYVQFSGCAAASRFSLIDSSKEENIPKLRSPWISHDYIVTCSRDGSAIIWIPRSRRSHKAGRWTRSYHLKVPPPAMIPQPTRGGPRQRMLPTPRGVNMIVWSLDNRFVLAAIMDCRICVWNVADGNLVHSLTGHTQSTYVLDVHPFNPRIAMSAGYDGKTIVWDIWEGTPIRIYEISRFKLVDGKFSPDGTSIILSDDVGQLYILSTGQGESQTDAKYDQFFLGDYRPLVQDTYGNTLDQESQLVPYRRNMQDLLCDSGMNPYPEPYQSMYQKRRLGALGVEWKPSSIRFAVGPDFSVDPDFQMLPLADLDMLLEPLPEFIDAMEWEPEINLQSDDTDSEYNVPEEYSSGGEQGSLSSSSSDDLECSTDDSDVEGNDGFRRSKRKKQKADIEIMTSSGRRVKKRNLDECDGNVLKGNQIRKSTVGRKASKRKSSTSKGFRPRRAAARNALTLFSRINGTASDAEDEVGSEEDLSESESTTHDSNVESDELDTFLQIERNRHHKGKDIFQEEPEVVGRSHEIAESHLNSGGRRPLLLKLPIRDPSKFGLQESITHRSGDQVSLVGSSSNTPHEGIEMNGFHKDLPDIGHSSADARCITAEIREQTGLSVGCKHGDIRWGRSRARTSKRQRSGEALSLAALPSSGTCTLDNKRYGDLEECLKPEDDQAIMSPAFKIQSYVDQNNIGPDTAETANKVVNGNDEHQRLNGCIDSDEFSGVAFVDHQKNEVTEFKDSPRLISTKIRIRSVNIPKDSIKDQLSGGCDNQGSDMSDHDRTNRIHIAEEPEESNALASVISLPTPSNDSMGSHSHSKKMFSVVYKRSKSSRDRVNIEGDGIRENISNVNDHNKNLSARSELHDSTTDGAFQRHAMGLMEPTSNSYIASDNLKPENGNEAEDNCRPVRANVINRPQVQTEEWVSSSRTAVGARSTRNRRTSYHYRDTSPVDKRKSQQSAKRVSWLMLSTNDGSRYIPQQGDEVVYLRQGHQEYIEYSAIRESVPWKSLKGNIRAVEFCRIETLEYSTVPGSGDSCCKMNLRFVDPASSVFQKSFKLTLPEVTGFPDFLVERTRFDAAMQRKWTCRDKCKVWWRNEGEEGGKWWEGRVLSVKPKSSEFPDSPWERYAIQYKSEPTETHLHSPWELFDANTQWEEPHIDDEITTKLLSAFCKLEQSGNKVQDPYGVQKLRQVVQKPNFTNRFPVPLSLEVIQSRLENNYYRSLEAVNHDVEVMLTNAESHWGKNADLVKKLKRLSEFLYQTFHSL